MTLLSSILEHNKTFVENEEYKPMETTKYPNKNFIVLGCMDARLVELLPKAMNVKNGDAKIIKTAGAIVSNPFGGIMRSLLVGVYALQADEIYVVGHYDCGMAVAKADEIIEHMVERGVKQESLDMLRHSGIDVHSWLDGFGDVTESVKNTVKVVREHPLLPATIPVHGLVIDPHTGRLDVVIDGYEVINTWLNY